MEFVCGLFLLSYFKEKSFSFFPNQARTKTSRYFGQIFYLLDLLSEDIYTYIFIDIG